jgi:hypothetical protein
MKEAKRLFTLSVSYNYEIYSITVKARDRQEAIYKGYEKLSCKLHCDYGEMLFNMCSF